MLKEENMTEKDLPTILTSFFRNVPQVSTGKHCKGLSFRVGKKIFGFIRDEKSVVMKLPREKVLALIETGHATPLVMGKRVMREWVVLTHEKPEEYQNDKELFQESFS